MKRLNLKMLKFLIAFIMFVTTANAYTFRHRNVNKTTEGYYYIMIGLALPLTNKADNASNLGANVSSGTPLGNIIINDGLNPQNGPITFPAKKIGVMTAIGYQSPYFFRTDFKIDFLNFARTYYMPQPTFLPVVKDGKIDFIVRQLGFIGSVYLDLENPTFITPYIGVGAGGVTTQAIFSATVSGQSTQEPGTSIISNLSFAYELKAGMKFGPKTAFLDIEAFIRKTPTYELETRGVMIKAGFRI